MADFNKILTPGNFEEGEINVVIEIPTGSNHKIEWDRKNACFMLDRVEPMAFAKPCNYGDKYQTLEDLPKQLIKQIEFHFNHYKDLKKPGTTVVKSFEGVESAKEVIKAAIERWNNAE